MRKMKKTGMRMTPQRMAILEYLDGNTDHPSAEDIFAGVREKYPSMSFATVYNTLEALKSRGGVLELTIDPGRKRYDPNTEPHHHLICLECRKIVDVHLDAEPSVPAALQGDFEVVGSHIEFYGVCGACRSRRELEKKGGELNG